MEFYEVIFFDWKSKKGSLHVHLADGLIRINSHENLSFREPCITIHVAEGTDLPLIQFKNAVISAFDTHMRRKGKVQK